VGKFAALTGRKGHATFCRFATGLDTTPPACALPLRIEAGTYTIPLGGEFPLGFRRCDPHGFNALILEPLGSMFLLALLFQDNPALLLVRIVDQYIFEAA